MDEKNRVLDVRFEEDGRVFTATYFIENGIIHAKVGESNYRMPIGPVPAEQMVRSLLIEKTRKGGFRKTLAEKWFGKK